MCAFFIHFDDDAQKCMCMKG